MHETIIEKIKDLRYGKQRRAVCKWIVTINMGSGSYVFRTTLDNPDGLHKKVIIIGKPDPANKKSFTDMGRKIIDHGPVIAGCVYREKDGNVTGMLLDQYDVGKALGDMRFTRMQITKTEVY